MNREMLKECIADAKTIRETAIASAKVALEEAFTPQLTAMFAEKLNELELEEAETEKEPIDEMYGTELEENFNLEEILAELSMEEGDEEPMKEEGMGQAVDEDLMLEEMSDEEIEELVMQVIDDMIASGKLMPGEGEEEDMEDMEDMDDEEINLEELLAEMDYVEETEEPVEEAIPSLSGNFKDDYITVTQLLGILGAVGTGVGSLALSSLDKGQRQALVQTLKDTFIKKAKEQGKSAEEIADEVEKGSNVGEATKKEMGDTINELRKELNEVNLLNAKLLYTNKIFKAKNLTESEKIKVLNTFDKAETVKEVKLVFETLTESFRATTAKKNPIKESLGSASKTIGTATPKQPIIEVNSAFTRMQQLAGLKK